MPDFPIGPYVWSHPPFSEALAPVDILLPAFPSPMSFLHRFHAPSGPRGDRIVSINRTGGAGATNVRAWNSYEWERGTRGFALMNRPPPVAGTEYSRGKILSEVAGSAPVERMIFSSIFFSSDRRVEFADLRHDLRSLSPRSGLLSFSLSLVTTRRSLSLPAAGFDIA